MQIKTSVVFPVLFVFAVVVLVYAKNNGIALAVPAVAEWKTGDFSIEIKDWDNPLGIEGVNNSGLNQSTCTYQVESLNPTTGLWEITRTATQRTCAIPIPITVGLKTGEGYKGTTDILAQTADCKYSGENTCRITAWAQDYAGNNSFGTEYMLTRIYSIDFGPPQAKITGLTSPDSGTQRGQKDGGAFLRAKDDGGNRTYTVNVEFQDEGNVGLDVCIFQLRKGGSGVSETTVRTDSVVCTGSSVVKTFSLTVGSTGDCDIQDDNRCTVWVWGVDKVGNNENIGTQRQVLNSKEKTYLDSSGSFPERINFFRMGVDYTAPHAQ